MPAAAGESAGALGSLYAMSSERTRSFPEIEGEARVDFGAGVVAGGGVVVGARTSALCRLVVPSGERTTLTEPEISACPRSMSDADHHRSVTIFQTPAGSEAVNSPTGLPLSSKSSIGPT